MERVLAGIIISLFVIAIWAWIKAIGGVSMTYASDEAIANRQWDAANEAAVTQVECRRPSVLYRPALMADGNMWCALYGEDLASGVAGFGKTPAEAMSAFDAEWVSRRCGEGGDRS